MKELGVGIVWFPPLAELIEERGFVDVVEVEPQIFWLPSERGERYRADGAEMRALRTLPIPKIAHGVGSPVGSPRRPLDSGVARFVRDVKALDAVWASEHLSFNRASGADGEFGAGFLLPPRQTQAAVLEIAATVREFAAKLPVPFAIETGVNYLRPRSDEMSDGAFMAAIAEAADCGILLDLHNLWCNELNGRQRVADFLAELPLDRVIEMHVAGGEQRSGYWLDAHCGAVPSPVLEIAAKWLPDLQELRAIIFEIMPDHVPLFGIENVRREIETLRRLWDSKKRNGRRKNGRKSDERELDERERSDAVAWENSLAALVAGRNAESLLAEELASDPGVAVLSGLVNAARAGADVAQLKLTTRLLRLSRGLAALQTQLNAHWAVQPPEMYGAIEAASFGAFLDSAGIDIPHFREVLGLERALLRIHAGGDAQIVHFTCDPTPLLSALAEGRLPEDLPYEDRFLRINTSGEVSFSSPLAVHDSVSSRSSHTNAELSRPIDNVVALASST
jgi:uncharacterized protein (UPF0276 family)